MNDFSVTRPSAEIIIPVYNSECLIQYCVASAGGYLETLVRNSASGDLAVEFNRPDLAGCRSLGLWSMINSIGKTQNWDRYIIVATGR